MSETTAKRNLQRLQRAIVDGLEDVKAQDIRVFDTSRLSPLFERVIIAAGTSNRQTKALAASVRDKVREAGFPKPRLEGEDNGEWIIVDCGAAVVHVMQPNIRSYYNLEEIWGDKPVRLKFGATRPAVATAAAEAAGATRTTRRRHAATATPAAGISEEKAVSAGKKRGSTAIKNESSGGDKVNGTGGAAGGRRKSTTLTESSSAARTAAAKSSAAKSSAAKSSPTKRPAAKKAAEAQPAAARKPAAKKSAD